MPGQVTVTDETLLVQLNSEFVSMTVRVHTPEAFRGTLICVHSFMGNGRDFDSLATFLAANGYRVICPDMLGRGGSAYFNDPQRYDVNAYLHTLANVARRFSETKISLLGVEWGGVMALLFARRYRRSIDHLVVAQVPLDWSTDKDPSIQLATKSPAVFSSSEAAAAYLATDDGTLVPPEPARLAHRVKHVAGGYALNHDRKLLSNAVELYGKTFALSQVIAALTNPLLLLYGDDLTEGESRKLDKLHSGLAGLVHCDGLGRRLGQFADNKSQLLVLGFLTALPRGPKGG